MKRLAWHRVGTLPLLLAAACGCAKSKGPATAPIALPPAVAAVFPDARASGIAANTEIWAEFGTALDPATVITANVTLTRDARRIPIAVTWDAPTRRVHVTPQVPLELRRTHTVTFGEDLRAADGTRLGAEFFWQFTTGGIRVPARPFPDAGATLESPFVRLSWDSTETSAGPILYSIYAANDSSAVAAHAVAPLAVSAASTYLPSQSWTLGAPVFWAVHAANLATGESADGPVWRFETLPFGTAVDSIVVPVGPWGQVRRVSSTALSRSCYSASITIGPAYIGAIDWDLSVLDADTRLADAYLLMSPSSNVNLAGRVLTIFGAADDWEPCSMGYPGPPYTDATEGVLATAAIVSPIRVLFTSPLLTAHVEARARGVDLHGYVLGADASFTYASSSAGDPGRRPMLVVKFYRSAPAASGVSP